ncbi:rCG45276, isoform CRA_b [Rattus norvegicus]|uniref:RCG45276, isoform CRA_b n=1 Tax=Rattus norvegicus TaxID=10116 RepID=A6K9E9_RAT|nr:rCG45276, isoform CRA_b [Rattus norvegicus]EDL87442.1 rCG45276, isoform CRA_b [Rattus norvegicus]
MTIYFTWCHTPIILTPGAAEAGRSGPGIQGQSGQHNNIMSLKQK